MKGEVKQMMKIIIWILGNVLFDMVRTKMPYQKTCSSLMGGKIV